MTVSVTTLIEKINRWLVLRNDLLSTKIFLCASKNQLALKAAIMALARWAEKREVTEVGGNVRGALEAIDRNEEFIKMTLAVMTTPE